MKILVQKFGGTSLSTPERRQQVVDKIAGAKRAGNSPVVVVSALGRCGESYATDTLLNLAKEECPSINSRELDMIMACGEIVAGVIIVGALKNAGFDAVLLNGQQAGIITTRKHGDAQIVRITPTNIIEHLSEGKIVVVAGFQGVDESGEITTLGRGGSDTSATALGASIEAAAVEIYTDVDGIMTADPRIVPAASTIEFASYEEVYQLAAHGARVIHPRAVEIAWHHNIPTKIKCTFTHGEGTTISSSFNGTVERLKDPSIVGIAHQDDYGIVALKEGNSDVFESAGQLLRKLVAAGVDADCLNVSHLNMEFVASAAIVETIVALALDAGIELGEKSTDCAKISLIGHAENNGSSLTNAFVEILRREEIEILKTFTGPYAISGIVHKKDMVPAVQALHRNLFEN